MSPVVPSESYGDSSTPPCTSIAPVQPVLAPPSTSVPRPVFTSSSPPESESESVSVVPSGTSTVRANELPASKAVPSKTAICT